MGFPNAYDKAHGRTGAHLMVHGDCSSRGCYAMTDEQIGEIYALARESFFGGQRAFQVQAYPFRMTRGELRQASQQSEHRVLADAQGRQRSLRGHAPGAEGRRVREALRVRRPGGGGQELRFDPAGRCPAYEVNQDLRDAVAEKQRADETQFASLVQRGTPTVAVRTGRDGGMHQTFLAKLTPRLVRDADGTTRYDIDPTAAAKLGTYVNPPRDPDTPPASTGSVAASTPRSAMSLASTEAKPPQSATRAGAPGGRTRSAASVQLLALGRPLERSEARSKARPRPRRHLHHGLLRRPRHPGPSAGAHRPPHPHRLRRSRNRSGTTAATSSGMMSGASPVVGANWFENRFGPAR